MSADLIARYTELTAQGSLNLKHGEFRQAAEVFQSARQVATQLQDSLLTFKAICNLSTAKLSMGQIEEAEQGLREILLKSDDEQVVYIASFNLASALRRKGRLEKALFYAKRALRAVESIDNHVWKATCHNMIGNIYMNMSYLDDALAEYRFALSLGRKGGLGTSYPIDWVKDGLGYCLLLKKHYRQGIAVLLEALQIAMANGNIRCLVECYQDLCFAYLLLKDLKLAEEYGEKALAIATEQDYKDILTNCYYLLGEVNLLLGNEERSDRYFDRLQELYPQFSVLKDFLRTFDVSNIINLKATF
jgi:tetratricopeptide (TPR) repeat protein